MYKFIENLGGVIWYSNGMNTLEVSRVGYITAGVWVRGDSIGVGIAIRCSFVNGREIQWI